MLPPFRLIALAGTLAIVLLLFSPGAGRLAQPVAARPTELCFTETGRCIRDRFLVYWQTHGGLRQQGLPVSDEFDEQQAGPPTGDGKIHHVQYFQRARFEWHPEYAGTEDEVLLGLLGTEAFLAHQRNGHCQSNPGPPPPECLPAGQP